MGGVRPEIVLLVVLGLLCLFATPPAAGEKRDRARLKRERIQAKIRREKSKLEELRAKEKSIFSQLRSLDALVALQRKKLAALKKERKHVEARIAEIDAERIEIEARLAQRRKTLAGRFRRMYMDGPPGALEVMLTAENYADLSRREIYYRAMVEADAELIREFRRDLESLAELLERLEAEKERLEGLEADMIAAKAAAERERAAKRELLRAAREDRETHEKVLRELASASRRIGGIMASHAKRVEQAEQAEPPVGVEEPIQPPVEGGFASNAKRMCAPCRGRLVQRYGMITNPRFGTKTFSKGIALAASAGAPVRAVWEGEVVYAGWFRGYGRIVILSHGDRYYTLYAHLSRIAAGKGRKVKRGQVVGYVGDTGSLEGPRLYFEVRRGAGSMNPLGWINLGCGG